MIKETEKREKGRKILSGKLARELLKPEEENRTPDPGST
jgi:hypothetical protein